VTNRDFTTALGRALRRPTLIPVPGWPLKLLLGDFARELLLGGQRVLPRAAEKSGFEFRYPQLDAALQAVLKP
jgi:NAD dependent epimerase/dehydratase family enzyme